MIDSRHAQARLLVAAALMTGACGAAYAGGGGRGGDSSMNPFTGDSYAYFHGGHNLGEGAMIRPGGTPPATGWQLYPPTGRPAAKAAPDAKSATQSATNTTRSYTPVPPAATPGSESASE
ncbi:MAG TPA: hypothetical protein VGI14_22525 [Casimicrobiaceae bacterium]|jgi:hypothetical protein